MKLFSKFPNPKGFADIDTTICEEILNVNQKKYENISKRIQLLNIRDIDTIAKTSIGDSLLVRRIKAIRQLIPGCEIKIAKKWIEENLNKNEGEKNEN